MSQYCNLTMIPIAHSEQYLLSYFDGCDSFLRTLFYSIVRNQLVTFCYMVLKIAVYKRSNGNIVCFQY